jgi:uncharacterized protein (DUF927 family)
MTATNLSEAEILHYYNSRVPKLHKSGSELRGPCPIHRGARDSFAVNLEKGTWFCHSNCGRGGDITAFEMAISGRDPKAARDAVFEILGRTNGTSSKRIVAEYNYVNETGALLFQCVRYEPKHFSQRRPNGQGGWVWNLRGVRRVLYKLPAVLAAPVVWLVEGEKDVEALTKLGVVVATCNPMGAGKWRKQYSEFLRGKEVFVIPDNDEPGRKHAETVARSLTGVAASIKLVELPGAKDAAEWIKRGGTLEGLVRLAEQADAFAPPAPESSNGALTDNADQQSALRGFVHSADGIYWFDREKDVNIFVCSPLEVQARTCDPDGEFWGRLLTWRDGHGREHRLALAMSLFAGDGVVPREMLLSGGVEIGASRRARELLSQFVQNEHPERSCTCVARVGWFGRVFIFPDANIPETNSVLFQPRDRVEHAWRTAGTLDEWRERIGRKCIGNSRLTFAASMSFAAPLLEPLGIEGGGLHFTGQTSSGKTTCAVVAGSVSGGGGRGFVRSWRATTNGLENVAEMHNHSLLVLDELSEMPSPEQINGVTYMLANGVAKTRLTASAAVRPVRTWRLLFLSSGELSISDHAQTARARTRGGSEVRLLNVAADAGVGLGIFEDLRGAASAREFADELKAAAAEVYGWPLREFLRRWTADWDANCAKVKQSMDEFLREALPPAAAPEVGRALRRIALIGAAGELATEWGITGWPVGEATRAAARIGWDWIQTRGGTGQTDVDNAIHELRRFIATKGTTHFQSLHPRYDTHSDPIVERLVERAGFWQEDEDGEHLYLLFPQIFREICRGQNSRAVLQELAKRDLLIRGEGEHLARYERIPNEGRVRLYAIRACILDGGDE